MKYLYFYALFVSALWIEGHAIRVRDWAQRRKMAHIPDVPENWEGMRSW